MPAMAFPDLLFFPFSICGELFIQQSYMIFPVPIWYHMICHMTISRSLTTSFYMTYVPFCFPIIRYDAIDLIFFPTCEIPFTSVSTEWIVDRFCHWLMFPKVTIRYNILSFNRIPSVISRAILSSLRLNQFPLFPA